MLVNRRNTTNRGELSVSQKMEEQEQRRKFNMAYHMFWQRPEMHGQIPPRIAWKLHEAGMMDVTQLIENIRSDEVVDESFQPLCEKITRRHFPHLISQKDNLPDHSWFYFMYSCLLMQDSEEYQKQEMENEKKKEMVRDLKHIMWIVGGGNEDIWKDIKDRIDLMRTNPKMALMRKEHPRWAIYLKWDQKAKDALKCRYNVYLHTTENPQESSELAFLQTDHEFQTRQTQQKTTQAILDLLKNPEIKGATLNATTGTVLKTVVADDKKTMSMRKRKLSESSSDEDDHEKENLKRVFKEMEDMTQFD